MIYDPKIAESFWSKRVNEVDELRAVLSYNAPHYINSAYDKWELNSILKSIGDVRGKKILDIACGVGRITIPLLEKGAFVFALDNSDEMISITINKTKQKKLTTNLTTIKSSADNIQLSNNSFDNIICVGLLEHLPDEIKIKVLEEILRLLKASSSAYLIINNKKSLFLIKDDNYKRIQQDSDGYFVSLIGLDFLEKFSAKLNYTYEIISSNFLYSYLKHSISALNYNLSDEILTQLFECASIYDTEKSKIKNLEETFADQFLVKILKG